MHKVLSFVKLTDGNHQNEVLQRLMAGPQDALGTGALVVFETRPLPPDFPYRPASDPTSSTIGAPPAYDFVLQTWHTADALAQLSARLRQWLGPLAGQVHPYHVEEQHVMDRSAPGETGRRTLISRLMFHADLPDSAARRSWRLHAPLVDRVHVGATRYVQNWVVAALDSDCPQTRGIPQLHFPSHQALVNGFFDSPRGRDEILQDTSHFVHAGPRLYTVEHPLPA